MGTHINAFKWQVQEKLEVAQKTLGDVKQSYEELLAKLSEDGTVEEQVEPNEEKSMQDEDVKPDEDVQTEGEVSEDAETPKEEPEAADTDSKG